LFEQAGFGNIKFHSEFTFEAAKTDENVFTVLAQKSER
jgi:hypothetical protein